MKKLKFAKLFNVFLVFFMVVSLINPVHVHAADASLVITNSAGEECDTFYVGEPIYVTANSSVTNDWVGLYSPGDKEAGKASWYWYYIDYSSYTQEGKFENYEEEGPNGEKIRYCWTIDEDGDLIPKRIEKPEDDTGVAVQTWKRRP